MGGRCIWRLVVCCALAAPCLGSPAAARAELPCARPARGALVEVDGGRFVGHGLVDICPSATALPAADPPEAITVEVSDALVLHWRRRFGDPRFGAMAVAAADQGSARATDDAGRAEAAALREAVERVIDGARAIRVTAHPDPEDEAAAARERARIVAAALVEQGQPPGWITVDVGPTRGRSEVVVSAAQIPPDAEPRGASTDTQTLFSGSIEEAVVRSASGPAGRPTLRRGWLLSLEPETAALGDFAVVRTGPQQAPVVTVVIGTATVGDRTTALLMADTPSDTLDQVRCSSVLSPREVISVESRRGPLLTARLRVGRRVSCDGPGRPAGAVTVQLLAPGWDVDIGSPAPYAVARHGDAGETTMTLTVDLGWGAGLGALERGMKRQPALSNARLRAIIEAAAAFTAAAEQTAGRETADGVWRDALIARRAWLKWPPCPPEQTYACRPPGYITRAERAAELEFVEAALKAPRDDAPARRWRAFQRALAR